MTAWLAACSGRPARDGSSTSAVAAPPTATEMPAVVSVCQDDVLQGPAYARIAWTGSEWGVFLHGGLGDCPAYLRVDAEGRKEMDEPVWLATADCGEHRGILDVAWRDGAFDVLWTRSTAYRPGARWPYRMTLGIMRVDLDGKVLEPWRPLEGHEDAQTSLVGTVGAAMGPLGFAEVQRDLHEEPREDDDEIVVSFYAPGGTLLHTESVVTGTDICYPSVAQGTDSFVVLCDHSQHDDDLHELITILRWSPSAGLLWRRDETYAGPLASPEVLDESWWPKRVVVTDREIVEDIWINDDASALRRALRRRSLETGRPIEDPTVVPGMLFDRESSVVWTGSEIGIATTGGTFRRYAADGTPLSKGEWLVEECVPRQGSYVSDLAWNGESYGVCIWSSFADRENGGLETRRLADGGVEVPTLRCPPDATCDADMRCLERRGLHDEVVARRYPKLILHPSSPLDVGWLSPDERDPMF